jgi:hypothetical protein
LDIPRNDNRFSYSGQRSYDLQLPVSGRCTPAALPGVPSNADNFIEFVDTALRSCVQEWASSNAAFNCDALYNHSFGGLFVVYVLIARPDSFDTFLVASPALFRNDDYVHSYFFEPLKAGVCNASLDSIKPAVQISYSHLEQAPVRRTMETADVFKSRKSILAPMRMMDLINQLYSESKGSSALRDVELHGHPFSDHAAVGGTALADGLDCLLARLVPRW